MFSRQIVLLVIKSNLCIVDDNKAIKVVFQDIGAKVQYIVNYIQVFNNRLYIGTIPNSYYYNEEYYSIDKPTNFISQQGGIIEIFNVATSDLAEVYNVSYITLNLGTYRKLIQKFLPMDIRIENNLIMAWGNDSDTSDNILYTYDGVTFNKLVDIVKINNNYFLDDKIFYRCGGKTGWTVTKETLL